MSDETGAIPGGEVVSYATDSTEPMSVEEAARELTQARAKALNPSAESAKSEEAATAANELAQANDGLDNPAPVEEPEGDDPEEKLPPIERPRSWSKDDDDDWNALPRERQEKIATSERAREADINRRMNEAADERKAVKAEREAAEQARQKYEAQLPTLMQALQDAQSQQFSDIKSMSDIEKVSNEIVRLTNAGDLVGAGQLQAYLTAFGVHQQKMQAVKAELDRAEGEKAQARQSKRADYEKAQNARLVELIPDMADPTKAAIKRESAIAMLTDDLGLKMEDLQRWMQDDVGHEILSNAGIQKLMDNGLTLKAIQSAKTAAAAKPLPGVQRPGTRQPANSGAATQIQALERQLSTASGDKAARISAEIYRLEKKVASR